MTAIDRRLRLVYPIYDETLKNMTAQVHSTPLSLDVVERHSIILSQTYNAIVTRGLGIVGGSTATLALIKEIATAEGRWDEVRIGLIEEIRRLTNVAVKQADGTWHQLPLAVAVQQGAIDPEDLVEVENVIAFFIVVSAKAPRSIRRDMLVPLEISGAQISLLNTTEFFASLRTSTATDSSGEKSHATAHAGPGRATATRDGKPSSVPA